MSPRPRRVTAALLLNDTSAVISVLGDRYPPTGVCGGSVQMCVWLCVCVCGRSVTWCDACF